MRPGVTERYVILEGRGRVELNEACTVQAEPVGPGSVVFIPPGTPECYEDLGEV